ncbi:DUF4265 domain-containing protein [Isoptericola croceus]|uniref:DUF4265 domain-containing protein n=1 Tax=Isoptericola croceus TaxID=3031406 RepID=UPI0023F71486|nr:DUF4265 domain-containing protein [Isoptericola croceus]
MQPESNTLVRLRVRLDQDEHGWPPAESEGLWATELAGGRYRLDNTPWFAFGLSADDVVAAHPDGVGVLWFVERLERGGRMTLRVIPHREGPLRGDPQLVLDFFAQLSVAGEIMGEMRLVALDVGPEHDTEQVKQLCISGEADGWWDYEEADITSDWHAAPPN